MGISVLPLVPQRWGFGVYFSPMAERSGKRNNNHPKTDIKREE
jgi:hypothetical protein